MRTWIAAASLIGALLPSPSAPQAASDHYSSLAYRSREGWNWNPDTGMWVNPKARYDKAAHQWVHDSRDPTTTACCDSTGLWVPGDAANDPDQPAPPKKQAAKPKEPSLRERLRRRLAEKANREAAEAAANIPRPGVNYGYTDDDLPAGAPTVAAYQPAAPAYSAPQAWAVVEETESGADSILGHVGNMLTGALDVAVAVAPLAGATAGIAATRSSAPAAATVRTVQVPRPPTQYPRAPHYGQSTISGTK